jgi:hypothetical protein
LNIIALKYIITLFNIKIFKKKLVYDLSIALFCPFKLKTS